MDIPKPSGKEKIIFEGSIFEIVKQPMKIGNKIKEFEFARRSPGIRLIIFKDRKLLLTKEFRPELNDYDYRLPGGKVFDTLKEYREALESKKDILKFAIEAAKKECIEEAGIKAKSIKLFQIAKAGSTVVWDLFYFIVDDFEKTIKKLEKGEIVFPEWKIFEEAKQMCLDNKIKEDRSVGVLLRFLLMNEMKKK